MGFSRQENWSGLLFPSPGYLPTPGIKLLSPAWQVEFFFFFFFTTETPGKRYIYVCMCIYICSYLCRQEIYVYIQLIHCVIHQKLTKHCKAAAAAKSLQSCPKPTRLPHPWDSPGKNTGVGCHFLLQCMKVKRESEVTQSCPTLNDPMDCSLPGSSIHGIFQARVLEWGAIAFSNCKATILQ